MSEANKAIAARRIEARNTWNESVLEELLAPDWRYRRQGQDSPPDVPLGPAGLKQLWAHSRGAFPNSTLTITDQIAEGDKVVTLWDFVGTHEGPVALPGISAPGGAVGTGRVVRISGVVIDRFENGKIVETTERADALGMLMQVGAIAGISTE